MGSTAPPTFVYYKAKRSRAVDICMHIIVFAESFDTNSLIFHDSKLINAGEEYLSTYWAYMNSLILDNNEEWGHAHWVSHLHRQMMARNITDAFQKISVELCQ